MRFFLGLLGKILAGIIVFSPSWIRRSLGDLVGFLWFDVLRIRRRVALENLRLAFPEKSEDEVLVIARGSLSNMGRTLIEFAQFPFFNRQKVEQFFVYEGFN